MATSPDFSALERVTQANSIFDQNAGFSVRYVKRNEDTTGVETTTLKSESRENGEGEKCPEDLSIKTESDVSQLVSPEPCESQQHIPPPGFILFDGEDSDLEWNPENITPRRSTALQHVSYK